jgi:hypothetical protein
MWIEVVIGAAVVAAVLGVLRRVTGARRPDRPSAEGPPAGAAAGAWSAQRPLDRVLPVERTERERAIGDAAFVDGLVVGHYLDPFRRDRPEGPQAADVTDRAVVGDDVEPAVDAGAGVLAGGADLEAGLDLDADLDLDTDAGFGYGGPGPSSEDHLDETGEDGEDGEDGGHDLFDDGFGFEDGFDDDW